MVSFSAGAISVLLLCLATASGCHFYISPLLSSREHVSWKGALTSGWVLDFGGCLPGDTPWPPGSGCQGSWYSWVLWDCDNQRVLAGFHSQDTTQTRLKHGLSMREAYWIFDLRGRLQVWYRSRWLQNYSQGTQVGGHHHSLFICLTLVHQQLLEWSLYPCLVPQFLTATRGHLYITWLCGQQSLQSWALQDHDQ